MEKIIDGFIYESKVIADAWDVSIFEVNGHREVSARNSVIWSEIGPVPPAILANMEKWPEPTLDEVEAARLRSLKKSAGRALTMCRRVIKAEGFNELLTLTYRENQADRELCKTHFKEWYRRMKKALGGFRFCASFEVQERGAMHVHVATHKLPQHANYKGVKIKAWELGTKIWRDIIGLYQFHGPLQPGQSFPEITNGLCFVGGKTRFGQGRRKNMSIGKMASYVSKYILKDYENSPEEKNRYSRSNGTVVPKPEKMRFTHVQLLDLIGLVFELSEGDVVVSHRIGIDQQSYWLVTEPNPLQSAVI